MAVSDGAPPGGAGAGAAGAPVAEPSPAAHQSPSVPSARPPTPPSEARAGAEDVLRTLVRSAVEKILKEAPWTFSKVNPLKEACRRFLREVALESAELEAADRTETGPTGPTGPTEPTEPGSSADAAGSGARPRASPSTLARLSALSARALVAACDSGRPALAEPALGAARELVASGCLVGTTRTTTRGVTKPRVDETAVPAVDADGADGGVDGVDADAACRALVASLCACASLPDVALASAGSAMHVAAVGALSACAVAPEFRLEGEALADALSALLRASAAAAAPETRAAAKTATISLINATFARAGFGVSSVDPRREQDEQDAARDQTRLRETREPPPPTPVESDALLVLLTLCERAAVPSSGEEKARAAERARRERGADVLAAAPPELSSFAAMATAFAPAAASAVALETRHARTRAVALDLTRQLLEGPASAVWLSRLAPYLGKPLRAALAAGVETEGCHDTAPSSRASAPAVARADPATAATASLARAAFTSLVLRARRAYKPEIARLYPRVVLAPLEGRGAGGETRASDVKNKLAALRVIRALASDPQVLVDVFVNHDCDARGDNLYERTIGALASSMAPGGGDQQKFRDGAVQCVLATVRSLRAWHARGAAPPLTTSPNGEGRTKTNGDDAPAGDSSESRPNGALRGASETTTRARDAKRHESSLSESETFASLKRRKASAEAATCAFNARPSVVSLAAAMEVSESVDETAEVDVADPGFPARAAAFLAGAGELDVSASVSAPVSRTRRRGSARSALDPSAVGELLGSHDVDALRVMKAYADAHDFAGLELDEALRAFVRPFRVPGEAQKIDRLVERFAARHCECNPSHFQDSDQAYVLAFAVVMLNTDAHNPKTDPKTKMSEDAFVAMAREGMRRPSPSGASPERAPPDARDERAGAAAPETRPWKYASDDALRGAFRRVSAREIEMSPGLREGRKTFAPTDGEDDEDVENARRFDVATAVSGSASDRRDASRRRTSNALAAATAETKAALERARELFSSSPAATRDDETSPFFAASDPALARPMLETAGAPLLRAVSRAFANADDAAHAALPLEGARAIVALATALNVPALRDGLCDFLARAPGLGLGFHEKKASGSELRGVGRHAVEAARTLLDLAAEARGLGEENWPVVLEVVSRMDALREAAEAASMGSVAAPDDRFDDRSTESIDRLAARWTPESDAAADAVAEEDAGARLARLLTCVRAPLRFSREDAPRVSSVSSSASIPLAPTRAELALGAWLASAEGAAALSRVFADAARFDDVEATGFVAALAGVAVADVWAPGAETREGAERGDERRRDSGRDVSSAAAAAPPLPSACPRAFAARRLAEVTARALERPRAVRAEIWSARVAPVLAGMAAHPDASVVRAAAEGLRVSAARFAARAERGGSPAALAAAFAPFADAHRWATAAARRDAPVEAIGDGARHWHHSFASCSTIIWQR